MIAGSHNLHAALISSLCVEALQYLHNSLIVVPACNLAIQLLCDMKTEAISVNFASTKSVEGLPNFHGRQCQTLRTNVHGASLVRLSHPGCAAHEAQLRQADLYTIKRT
jgi:hypothetical protein